MELRPDQNNHVSFQSAIPTRIWRLSQDASHFVRIEDAKNFPKSVRALAEYLEKRTPICNNPRPDIVRTFADHVKDYKEPGCSRDEGSLIAYNDTDAFVPFLFTGEEAAAIHKAKAAKSNVYSIISEFAQATYRRLYGYKTPKDKYVSPLELQAYTVQNPKDPNKDILLDIAFTKVNAGCLSLKEIEARLTRNALKSLIQKQPSKQIPNQSGRPQLELDL